MRALWVVMAIAACGSEASKGPLPLEVKATYAVEGDLERMDVSVHTIPGSSISAVISKMSVSAIADAKGDAQLRVPINPVATGGELELVVDAYQPPGKKSYFPGVNKSKVTRTPIIAIDFEGRGACRMKTCSVNVTENGHLEIRDLVDVASVSIDGAVATVKNGIVDVPLDVEALASKVSMQELFKRHERGEAGPTKLAVAIAWNDGTALKSDVPVPWYSLREAVIALLSPPKPITLKDPGSGKGVLRTDPPSVSPDVAKLGDIGIVVHYGESLRPQECGTYKNEKGETAKLLMYLRDTTVVITELATGKSLGEKIFPTPKTPCPKVSTGAMPEARYERGDTDVKWVDSILTHRR